MTWSKAGGSCASIALSVQNSSANIAEIATTDEFQLSSAELTIGELSCGDGPGDD